MQFATAGGVAFEIPEDSWRFADVDRLAVPNGGGFYPYAPAAYAEVVPTDVQRKRRRARQAIASH